VFREFLNNIVTKDIRHKLQGTRVYFAEYLVLLVTICCFKVLLNELRSGLIATKFFNMLIDILNTMLALGVMHKFPFYVQFITPIRF